MIDRTHPTLPVTRQCRILNVSRATVYRHPAAVSDADLELMALIDRQYLIRPFYGSRRMAAWLNTQGHAVNRKRVQRLMRWTQLVRQLGWRVKRESRGIIAPCRCWGSVSARAAG